MSTNIKTYLKYANLQIAAEAFYGKKTTAPAEPYTGVLTIENLTIGNDRSSKFTETQARAFIKEGWTVVEHISNTTTGFSGTLFKNSQTGELVLSLRSTEFIDDAVRDNQATNALEIKEKGWAFGQIADMEGWFSSLKSSGKLDPGAAITVTGYSLGGHLATAFNLLRQDEQKLGGPANPISATYTFNGAGVGKLADGVMLEGVLNVFKAVRAGGASDHFQTREGLELYEQIKKELSANASASQINAVRNSDKYRCTWNWAARAIRTAQVPWATTGC